MCIQCRWQILIPLCHLACTIFQSSIKSEENMYLVFHCLSKHFPKLKIVTIQVSSQIETLFHFFFFILQETTKKKLLFRILHLLPGFRVPIYVIIFKVPIFNDYRYSENRFFVFFFLLTFFMLFLFPFFSYTIMTTLVLALSLKK